MLISQYIIHFLSSKRLLACRCIVQRKSYMYSGISSKGNMLGCIATVSPTIADCNTKRGLQVKKAREARIFVLEFASLLSKPEDLCVAAVVRLVYYHICNLEKKLYVSNAYP